MSSADSRAHAAASKLELRGLRQCYEGVRGKTLALDGLDLRVAAHESVAILGPSGCGKSTSLLAACGLQKPTEGTVLVDGAPLAGPRLETALILQDFGLMPWKTVEQNAALGLQVRQMPKRLRLERAREALRRVGLEEFAQAYPSELSGGMRQRLAMARALACDIDLLLMDEPLSALDALLREEMQNMLKRCWREAGYAQVLVTHSIEEAVFLGQRIVVMTPRPGRVAAVVENAEMLSDDWRDAPLFFERCRMLRDILRREGADASTGAGAGASADAGLGASAGLESGSGSGVAGSAPSFAAESSGASFGKGAQVEKGGRDEAAGAIGGSASSCADAQEGGRYA
ncbi:MAG: ABC transporter ATP-binding protein [Slackia sp.]|nr:ABC transporter ATP-binding protein [Slackia sp.]